MTDCVRCKRELYGHAFYLDGKGPYCHSCWRVLVRNADGKRDEKYDVCDVKNCGHIRLSHMGREERCTVDKCTCRGMSH